VFFVPPVSGASWGALLSWVPRHYARAMCSSSAVGRFLQRPITIAVPVSGIGGTAAADARVLQQVRRERSLPLASVSPDGQLAQVPQASRCWMPHEAAIRLGQHAGLHLEEVPAECAARGHPVRGHQPVLGVIGTQRQQVGVTELGHCGATSWWQRRARGSG
jgi:hypothetical protein